MQIREYFLSGDAYKNHHSFSESYGNFSEILYAMDDLQGAISYLKKAIRIYLSHPTDDPLLSTTFNLLADIELRYEKTGLAYRLTKEAVRLCKNP